MSNKETLQEYNERLGTNNITLDSILETINKLPEAGSGEGAIGQKCIYLIKDGVVQVENTGEYSYKMTNGDAEVSVIEQDGYLGLCSKCWSDGTFTFANTFDLKRYSNIHIDFAYPSASSPYAYQNATSILHVGSMSTYNTLFNKGATTQRKTVVAQIPDGSEEDTITFVCSNLGDGSTYTKYPFRLYNLYIENPDIQVQDKEIEITENGVYNITKDEDYIALNSVEVTVDVEPNLQDKDVEINENGVTTVTADEGFDGLNSVEIVTNVSSSGDATIGDGLISGTLSEYASDNLTSIREYAFYYNSNIAAITTPNVKSISKYAFYKTTYLQTITIPSVTSIREQAFYNSAVKEINVPVLTTLGDKAFYGCSLLTTFNAPLIETLGSNAFQNCSKLQTVHIPNIKSISHYCFSNCSKLASIDLHNCTEINHYAFQSCNALAALILRSSTLCTLGVYVFSSTSPIALGTGYIYVPSALLEDYKTATNWSDYASQFKSIEELPDTDV